MQADEKHMLQNGKKEQERLGRGSRLEIERKDRGIARGQGSSGTSNNGAKRFHPSTIRGDMKAKLERSRQSARECRARKKLRYQYLEELVASREQAVLMLRQELDMYKQWCREMENGTMPDGLMKMLSETEDSKAKKSSSQQESKPPPAQQ